MIDTFLTNRTSTTFLDKIKEAFRKCSSFKLSVSFIKKAGLVLIEKDIEDALKRGVKGQIITSSYQNFTDIVSLNKFKEWMDKYPSFSCHFDFDCFGEVGFHSKGYIFEYKEGYELIVGSSNITRFALLNNVEWDISLYDKDHFSSFKSSLMEFDTLWNKTLDLTSEVIKNYTIRLAYAIEKWDMDYISSFDEYTIKPNMMQREALRELRRYRDMNINKALIVAATGSGKTYLAAFDAFNINAKRLLYVVHRESILVEARKTFIKVFGNKRTFGLFTGDKKELDADYIFATNTELSNHLSTFEKTEFDYIVLDECHHSTSSTYQNIIAYFKPSFLLGLTATPNRMDNQDVLSIFDKNVPYELSISDALNNDLIVPFKYFAIKDDLIDYSLDKRDTDMMIRQISSPLNCQFIAKAIREHLPDSGKLKAVAFCRTIDHAKMMAQGMKDQGFATTYLTGASDTGERLKAFEQLQDENDPLQMIFTVDILNEGVDIPAINMVLFLRPTDSQTIFIQQLGRGLRKYKDKDYLTVLDFIANYYERSIQIALALGSLSKNMIMEKHLLTTLVKDDYQELNLPIEIHFDEKSKAEILEYIEHTNFNRKDFLRNDYMTFKRYLNLVDDYPKQTDYLNNACAPDLMRFINSSLDGTKNCCYYLFLKKINEENLPTFSEEEIDLLKTLSEILPLVRPDEYMILSSLLKGDKTKEELISDLKNEFRYKPNQFDSAIDFLTNKYLSVNQQESSFLFVTQVNNKYHLNLTENNPVFKDHLIDLLTYGLERFKGEMGDFEGDFKIYGNYTTEQIMMVLCKRTKVYMKGTIIHGNNGYILAGLKKDASTSERLNYKDKFIDASTFQWESETQCSFNSTMGRKVLNMRTAGLFIRKMKSEDGINLPFTYIGRGTLTNPRESDNPGKTLLFDVKLDHPVEEQYRYDLLVPEKKAD